MDSSRVGRVLCCGLAALTVAVGAVTACGNYVPPDVANYGPAEGLTGKQPPVPSPSSSASGSSSGAASGSSSGSGTGSSSGSATGSSSGSSGSSPYACVNAGGSLIDAGSCTVSFTNDIYPQMESSGTWLCASSACHGNTATAPFLNGTTAESFYDSLAAYTGTTAAGLAYINPCSTNPAQSDFVCNTVATGTCGTEMPLGLPISDAGLEKIST